MGVTVQPQQLTAAGVAAQQVADGPLASSSSSIGNADAQATRAHIEGFESDAPLGSLFLSWDTAARNLQARTRSTGEKLVTTASIYVSTDTLNTDLFERVPVNPHGADE